MTLLPQFWHWHISWYWWYAVARLWFVSIQAIESIIMITVNMHRDHPLHGCISSSIPEIDCNNLPWMCPKRRRHTDYIQYDWFTPSSGAIPLPPYRQLINNVSRNYLPKPVIKDIWKCFCKLRKWHSSLGFGTSICPEIGGVQTLDFIYKVSELSNVL